MIPIVVPSHRLVNMKARRWISEHSYRLFGHITHVGHLELVRFIVTFIRLGLL